MIRDTDVETRLGNCSDLRRGVVAQAGDADHAIDSIAGTGNLMTLNHRRSPMTRWLAAGLMLLLCALAQGGHALAQTSAQSRPGGFTPEQRAEIVEIVRAALKSDPSILRDAVQALESDETLRHEAAARTAIAGATAALASAPADQIAGNPAGDVTIVEFYDPRCPYCRRMLPVAADVLRHDTRIRWVYKEIPILGPASVTAAKAVLAAQRQGKYGAMHDALMTGTPDVTPAVVQTIAASTGLDWAKLQRDMDDPTIKARLDANVELARQLGIDGTPAYVIGGRLIPGAVDEATLLAAVASARSK
jgi:protein-disulfide isomerase